MDLELEQCDRCGYPRGDEPVIEAEDGTSFIHMSCIDREDNSA